MSDHSPETEKNALITRYADLLDAQADIEEVQLIDDLETLYASARVPAQLIAEGLRGLEEPGRLQGSPLPYTEIPPGIGGRAPAISLKRRVVAVRGRRWANRLNALVAVLIAAVLVGSLLLVVNLAYQTKAGKQPGQINIAKGVGAFSFLHMIDAHTGWAWTGFQGGHHHILRTTDGGEDWEDVTPPVENVGDGSQPYFLNASLAWVAMPQGDRLPWLLYRTTDGGQTWQQSTLPLSESIHIDFVDALHGWATVDLLTNSTFSEMDIYHTIDRGQTWNRIAVSTSETDNVPAALPFASEDNGVTFINQSTGWITGSSNTNVNHSPRLYITHDGGHHWYQQALALPRDLGLPVAETVIGSPQFFSRLDGILPVGFWVPRGFDAYITHDGGATWHDTSFVPLVANPYWDAYAPTPPVLFMDINHGWVWVTGTPGLPSSFETTSDGGRHWTKTVPDLPSFTLNNYSFVSGSTGWAIGVDNARTSASLPSVLVKTTDGGKTWKQIQYMVS